MAKYVEKFILPSEEIEEKLIEDKVDISEWNIIKEIKDEFGGN